MNMLLTLIIVTLISTIIADPVQNINTNQQISNETRAYVQLYVDQIEHLKGWQIDGSLESNVVRQIDQQFDAGYTPVWDSKLSNKENLINLIDSLLTGDLLPFDLSESVSENIHFFIEVVTRIIYLEEDKVLAATRFVTSLINHLNIPDLDVEKTLKINVDTFVTNVLAGIGASSDSGHLVSPMQIIVDFTKEALKLIKFKGYSSQVTLHDNVNVLLDEF